MTRTAVRGGSGVRAAAAVSLALMTSVGVAACGSTPTAPPTSTVQRGSVSTMVSASGSLSSVTSQNMGFANAAQLTELDVKVGDVVKPGQLLAREDPFSFQQLLNQQQSQLANQQAQLDKLTRDVSVPDLQRSQDQAETIFDRTKRNVDAQDDLNDNAVRRAEVSLRFVEKPYRQAQRACDQAREKSETGGGTGPDTGCGRPVPTNPAATTFSGVFGTDSAPFSGSIQPPSSGGSAQSSAATALATAKQNYITAQTNYQAAKHTRDVDRTQGDLSVANAKQTLISAQSALREAATNRPSDIAAQAALVANQAALVAQAQRNLNDTQLFAPVGGTVSAITGTVGEYMSAAGSGTTALAPGSDAAIPGVGAAATSDQSGNASSGISATRPGGGFIVLNNINTFQVVVPFEESDAAKVAPNQKVQVTFDAIPDLERDGTVLSIAPNGVNISGVTNYYATILLTQSDPRLKDGQTAEASVVTNSLDNVVVVPNSAVIKSGGNSYVNTPGPDGKPQRTQFTPGAVGDDNTQVISGLREGQQILLPQAGASPAGGGGRSGGGGHGGG